MITRSDAPRTMADRLIDVAAKCEIESLRPQLADTQAALDYLADLHHRTLTGSSKHDPEHIESYRDCPCKSCKAATAVLGLPEGQSE